MQKFFATANNAFIPIADNIKQQSEKSMSYAITFVAANTASPLRPHHVKALRKIAQTHNVTFEAEENWLAADKAIDVFVTSKPQKSLLKHFRNELASDNIDVFTSPLKGRKKKLLLADMDSTMVAEETLDELAAYAGIKDEIAAITKEAMEGHLDFHEALRKRVGLLKDLEAAKLQETLDATMVNPGARELIATMRAGGARCVLVSGGFTFFTGAIAAAIGFHHHHGNQLKIENERLTGEVIEPIQDKHSKLEFLRQYSAEIGIDPDAAMTIGDGANDLPMLKAAGLGIGYHPKPLLIEELDNVVLHGDLSSPLYAQGYSESEITNALENAA